MKRLLPGFFALCALSIGAQAQTDVTSEYLANPSFEEGVTYDVSATGSLVVSSNMTNDYPDNGWTISSHEQWAASAIMAYGTAMTIQNSSQFPQNGPDGAAGLAMLACWRTSVTYQQAVTLPAGFYKLTCSSYNAHTSTSNATSNFGFTSTGASYLATKTSFPSSEWIVNEVGMYLSADTEGAIQIQLAGGNTGSRDVPHLVYDDVKLYSCTPSVDQPFNMTNMVGTSGSAWNGGNNYTSGGIVMVEKYSEKHYTGNVMKQTVSGLPNGVYIVELYGAASCANWNCDPVVEDGNTTNTILTVNSQQQGMPTYTRKGVDTPDEFTFNNVVVSDGTLSISIDNVTEGANWVIVQIKSLQYLGVDLSALQTTLNELIEKAQSYTQESLNIASYEALQTAISQGQNAEQTEEGLNAAISALNNAISNADAIIPSLAEAKVSIANYQAIANNSTATEEVATAYAAAITKATSDLDTATVVSGVNTVISELESDRQTYVLAATPNEGYTFDYTFLIKNAAVTSTTDWKNARINSGEQYTDAPDNTYFDNWNATLDMYQDIDCPRPGLYRLTAATRAHSDVNTGYIYLNDVQADIERVGNSGNTLGAGWAWTTLDAMISGGTMRVGFYSDCTNSLWAGADNFKLEFVRDLTEDELLDNAKQALADKITEVEAKDIATNVGTAAFQIPESLATAVTDALNTANAVTETATLEDVQAATQALTDAVAAFDNATLNAPAEGQVFNIEITTSDNYQLKDLPLTLHSGGAKFTVGQDANYYAQTLMLKQVEGNLYTISTVLADGQEYYLRTNENHGGNVNQIRTTTDVSEALKVEVIVTSTQGVYNLRNMNANALLGCQDDNASGGLYTTTAHSTLTITEVQKPTVTVATTLEWGTLILPFAAEIPTGLAVYSCDGTTTAADGITRVNLTEVTDGIAANTPYIVKAAADFTYTFEGFGAAEATTYTAGSLTGMYEALTVPAGSYVLQNQSEVEGVAFYCVADGTEFTGTPNRAYLTIAAAGVNVRVIQIGTGEGDGTTGVAAVAADGDSTVDVYSVSGVVVRKGAKASEALNGLQPGIYIVNGVKKAVK